MSNRTKLGLSLALLLLALIVITTWYGMRRAPEIAEAPASSAAGDKLGVADKFGVADKAIAPPTSPEPQGPAAISPSQLPREPADSRAISQPRAGTPRAATARVGKGATRSGSKHKGQPAEESPAAAEEAQPAASATPPAATVAPPPTPTGTLVVRHHNGVGNSLQLIKVTYFLDGSVAFTEERDKLAQSRDLEAFTKKTSVGEHAISVVAEFQGNGGVFSYFDNYRYKAQSANKFIVREN